MWTLLLAAVASAVTLTHAEVARHDQPDDCWLVIDGAVYDITALIPAHPGAEAIARGCGKDASWFFANRDGVDQGHSEGAIALREAYRLGALGDEIALDAEPADPPHPHDLRLAGAWAGTSTAQVGPRHSVVLRVGHALSTVADVPTAVLVQVGYSFGFLDLLVSEESGARLGGLEAKWRVFHQHGERPAPLSVAVVGGVGFARAADAPAVYGVVVVERDLLDRRLTLRLDATGAISPGVDDSAALSVLAGMEFRPIPVHGVFASVRAPSAQPGNLDWTAGVRFHTRLHVLSLHVASSPALSPWEQAAPTRQAVAIGGAVERAFLLPRRRGHAE